MSKRAVLYVDDHAVGDARYRSWTLDCQHATSTVQAVIPSGTSADLFTDEAMVAMAQERHEATCTCGRRYVRGGKA